jgi:antitoxin ParD1/3/4
VPQAETRSVALPPEQARYIDALVASGEYDSSNAVVLAALRAFQAREDALARWVKLQVVPVLGALQPNRDWAVEELVSAVRRQQAVWAPEPAEERHD